MPKRVDNRNRHAKEEGCEVEEELMRGFCFRHEMR